MSDREPDLSFLDRPSESSLCPRYPGSIHLTASTLPAPPHPVLGASPFDDTRSTYVHTGVNRVVAKFVTLLSPYTKLPSTYEAMDVEVISFLLTQVGYEVYDAAHSHTRPRLGGHC